MKYEIYSRKIKKNFTPNGNESVKRGKQNDKKKERRRPREKKKETGVSLQLSETTSGAFYIKSED